MDGRTMTELSAGQLPELTTGRLLTTWHLDVPALLLVIALGALYGWGVARLRRRGEPWPPARVVAFALLGLGGLVVATMSALAARSWSGRQQGGPSVGEQREGDAGDRQ
ncbi:cytochrome c oxidase assembly protein, partial [Streptomyces sp. NPDC002586]